MAMTETEYRKQTALLGSIAESYKNDSVEHCALKSAALAMSFIAYDSKNHFPDFKRCFNSRDLDMATLVPEVLIVVRALERVSAGFDFKSLNYRAIKHAIIAMYFCSEYYMEEYLKLLHSLNIKKSLVIDSKNDK